MRQSTPQPTPTNDDKAGAGESGKSTIVKQMKIIHLNGYTPQALLFFRTTVYKNLVESAQDLILAMKRLAKDCHDSANRVRYQYLASSLS